MDADDEISGPGGKRARTRATLVRATLEVVAEKGFGQASLADIAARAGMSTGAIYSNFEGKADLLYAAMASKGLVLQPAYVAGGTLKDQLNATAKALIATLPRALEEARFTAEYYAYSLTDTDLAGRNQAWYAGMFTSLGEMIETHYGEAITLPPRALMVAIQCLGLGFVEQYSRTPDEVTPQVVIAAYEALADGVSKPMA